MRVLRGRGGTIDADRELSTRMLDRTVATGEPAVRVWRPHRQVVFGRRDASDDCYEVARAAAREHGFPPVERDVGGRAVAYTGTTVAFARAEPIDDIRVGLAERYERATADVERAIDRLGVTATRGEPQDSFCPGTHSLQVEGKIAGIAQRVRQEAAVVAGVLIVADHEEIGAVLGDVYGALGVPFDPETVGSLERAGSEADPERVVGTVEAELVGDAEADVERVA
jgi:lipoate-protein ligase A